MSISVVIPNYNGEKILAENISKIIRAIQEYSGEKEIIVTDDASTDNSVRVLQEIIAEYSDETLPVTLLIHSQNKGFSSNVNEGVKAAHGEIIILLNTDIIPEKGFLKPLLSHFIDEKLFAVGCMDKSIEGDHTVLRGRGLGAWKKGLFVHTRGEVTDTNTLWVSGGSGAFRRSVWEKLGGLDPIYNPFYWEDIDLSYRAQKAGYRVVFEPESVVIHEHDKGSIKTHHISQKVSAVAYRNQFIFIWKNITDQDLVRSHLLWLPVHIGKALLRGDKTYLRGFWNAVTLLPRIRVSHRKVRKTFLQKDIEVIASASF